MSSLQNKIALVTGANSGLGQAAAIELAKSGAIVVATDLAEKDSAETMEKVRSLASESTFLEMDVSKEDQVKSAIAKAVDRFSQLDIAVNNAGILPPHAPIHESRTKDWQRVINVNLTGQYLCAKYELQQFLKQGEGTMVNVASMAAFIAGNGHAAYTATKHGLAGLTKAIASEYGDKNIRVNAICPYYIMTNMLEGTDDDTVKAWREATPMKRLGETEEFGKAVVFLASDESSYCHGMIMPLDGGKLVW